MTGKHKPKQQPAHVVYFFRCILRMLGPWPRVQGFRLK
jgi:hypothetical protein